MECDAAGEQLGAFLDDELPTEVRRSVEAHLATCRRCAGELESLRAMAARLAAEEAITVPPALWTSIEERLDRASRESTAGAKLRLFRRPMAAAAGVLLLVGLGLVAFVWLDGGMSRAEASVIDYAQLLDELALDPHKAFSEFLTRQRASKITPQAAHQRAPDLNFVLPDTLPGGFRLTAVYALQFGRNPGIAARYSRGDEFLATLFHPPVRREDFGTHKDYPCVIGQHRGYTVNVGQWRMVHLTDPTTCHCVLSKLDVDTELPAIMAAVTPESPASGSIGQHH